MNRGSVVPIWNILEKNRSIFGNKTLDTAILTRAQSVSNKPHLLGWPISLLINTKRMLHVKLNIFLWENWLVDTFERRTVLDKPLKVNETHISLFQSYIQMWREASLSSSHFDWALRKRVSVTMQASSYYGCSCYYNSRLTARRTWFQSSSWTHQGGLNLVYLRQNSKLWVGLAG